MIVTILESKTTLTDVTYAIDEETVPKDDMRTFLDTMAKDTKSDDDLRFIHAFCNEHGEVESEDELDPYSYDPVSVRDDYEIETDEWIDYMMNKMKMENEEEEK